MVSDATTRGPWDDVPRKSDAQQVIDLEATLGVMNEMMRENEAKIRALDAVLNELVAELDPEIDWVHGEEDGKGSWRVFGAEVCAEASEMPNFTRWRCQRKGVPNPLEGGEG